MLSSNSSESLALTVNGDPLDQDINLAEQQRANSQDALRKKQAINLWQYPFHSLGQTLRAVAPAYIFVTNVPLFVLDGSPDIDGRPFDPNRPLKLTQMMTTAFMTGVFYQTDRAVDALATLESPMATLRANLQSPASSMMMVIRSTARGAVVLAYAGAFYSLQSEFPQNESSGKFVTNPFLITLAIGGGSFVLDRGVNLVFDHFPKTRAQLGNSQRTRGFTNMDQRIAQGTLSIGLDFMRGLGIAQLIRAAALTGGCDYGVKAWLSPLMSDIALRANDLIASPGHINNIDECNVMNPTKTDIVKSVGWKACVAMTMLGVAYGMNKLTQLTMGQFGETDEAQKSFGQVAVEAVVPFVAAKVVDKALHFFEAPIYGLVGLAASKICFFRGSKKDEGAVPLMQEDVEHDSKFGLVK